MKTNDTIEFESRVHDRLDDHTVLEEFDLVCTGSLARVIAWPRGTLPRFAYGEKVRYYRERIEAAVHGSVYIPPPRPEFATAEECKPNSYSSKQERALLDMVECLEIEIWMLQNARSACVPIPLELAKAVYKELAPGMTGKPVRELLRLIDEEAT